MLHSGIIRLDNAPDPAQSTETHYLYNLNENLIMYSAASTTPDIIAPDSICYYSESTGRGFSNASDDLAEYFDPTTGRSTGNQVSVIAVQTAPKLYNTPVWWPPLRRCCAISVTRAACPPHDS